MAQELFRKSALEKLSSPEQLDQLFTMAGPKSWAALLALLGLLAVALLWGIFGSVPSKIAGQGILLKDGGVFEVVATGSGLLAEMAPLKSGGEVRKGQVIGRIAQPLLEQEIRLAEKSLEDARHERERVARFVEDDLRLQKQSLLQQRATQLQAANAKRELIASLEKSLASQEALRRDGVITQQRFEEAKQRLYAARQEWETIQNQLKQIEIQTLNLENQHRERMKSSDDHVFDAQDRLDRLKAKADVVGRVVSSYDGKVVEIMAAVGDMISEGKPLLSIQFGGKSLEVELYLPPHSEIKRVRPGTPVQISPNTAKREEYGFMLGRIVSVSEFPATPQGMMALLNNESLVRLLSQQGAPFAAHVELLPDAGTVSGYRWSSQAGARLEVSSGTLCSASVILRQQAPITLVIPLLKKFLGVD